ncbi:facilitated trehalose transporter Tret1-like [Daktulosphaira vitifoliae]|uniref:facilitated trehalose transporter Tret1-like n=1 Tax=Daktulosphaira vitifoliae TaxID=58002 RepID=UPI0021A9FBE3|nr:facilitated trehalose transporter Tret1-like [Daktulosphaira vitifoliae]XP_050533263.1 facilitated trehalose transporter Tret1-like [Daktulosphaira vitifoliae]
MSANYIEIPSERDYGSKATLAQTLAVIAQSLLLINLGMELLMPTIVLGDVYLNKNGEFLLTSTQASWYGSILYICHPPGSLISGFLQEKVGRKRCMILANIPSIIGWTFLHFATSPTMLFISSLSMGLSIGFNEAPIFSYIGEVTEPRIRGQLAAVAQGGLFIGSFLTSVLGYFFKWKIIALISVLSPIICILFVLMIPESPVWLANKGKNDKAIKSLCWLRGWVDSSLVKEEYKELIQYNQLSGTHHGEAIEKNINFTSRMMFFKDPLVYRPLRLILVFFLISQILSIIPCRPYLKHILTELGLVTNQSLILILFTALQIVPCFLTIIFVKKYGKRFLSLIGLIANTAALFVIGLYLMLIKNYFLTKKPWIFLILLCWIYSFSYILICLPWTVMSEIYPYNVRGIATGLSAAFYYFCIFCSTRVYLSVEEFLSLEYTMILFGVIGVIGSVYVYFYLPETENKSLLEIEEIFESNKRVH